MASAGFDRTINIWNLNPDKVVLQGDTEASATLPHTIGFPLQDHKNAILDLKWPSNPNDQD
jgi:Prp8 binding protein